MFARILTFSLAHRWTVLLGVLVLIAAGCWVVYTIPVDAFPEDVQEWEIKPELRTIPGVSDVNTWGGETKQYQIKVDPALLQQYGLTLKDLATRVAENNTNFGGGYIEHAYEQYTLRGLGRTNSVDDISNIVLLANQGTPVMLHDVAPVTIGPAPRQGAVLRNGEAISGMVIMLKGENGKHVIELVKQKIASLHL